MLKFKFELWLLADETSVWILEEAAEAPTLLERGKAYSRSLTTSFHCYRRLLGSDRRSPTQSFPRRGNAAPPVAPSPAPVVRWPHPRRNEGSIRWPPLLIQAREAFCPSAETCIHTDITLLLIQCGFARGPRFCSTWFFMYVWQCTTLLN